MAEKHSELFTFPRLSDFNYATWKTDMKVLLMDRGCWEFINGEAKPCPDSADDKEKQAYSWRKQRAYTTIYQGIERKFHTLIADTVDGKIAWEALKSNFEPTSRARLAGLVDEFFEMRYDSEEETVGIFSKKITEKRLQVKEAGFDIPELLVCFQLIRRLPPEYDNLVQHLYRGEDVDFTVDKVTKQLLTEAGRIELKRKDEGKDYNVVGNAYAARSKTTFAGKKQGYAGGRRGSGLDPKVSRFGEGSARMGPCGFCLKPGHTEDRCFLKKNRVKKNLVKEENGGAFYADTHIALATTTATEKLQEFLVDSAATSHCCNQKDWFTTFKYTKPSSVLIGDKDCSSKVLGIGDIDFVLKDISGNVNIKLKNVLYTPNMRRNLIGGSNIDVAGYKVIWGDNKMVVYTKDDKYFFTVPLIDKLYVARGYPKSKNQSVNLAVNINTVHRRFGHVNIPLIEHMSKNNSVKGIEKLSSKNDDKNCDVCKIAKSTRVSLKSNYTYKRLATKVLERVYMDLWGPAPVNSLGGKKYFLSIIDDYSRKVEVYVIKSKTEVFDCFKTYLAKVERETNSKLKSCRTDNGLEFCHKEFESFLSKLGIKHERTSTYTSEQNGVAEKFNRTAMDGVRAMLQDSGLQPRFWAEALVAFVHIRNRCEHKLTEGLTPIELWSGHKPSVRHFKIFGSLAFVHIPKVHRNKLQPRAKPGILVGYATGTKGYRIFIPKEHKVIETIHVKIDETKNGVNSLFGKDKFNDYVKFNLNMDFDDSIYLNDKGSTKGRVEESKIEISNILNPLNINEWNRVEKPRTMSDRIDVYYYPPNSSTRLRSIKDAKKYCVENKIEFDPDKFCFKPDDVEVTNDLNSINVSIGKSQTENLNDHIYDIYHECYFIEMPKSFEETQRSPDKDKWNAAMADELKIMKDRQVWDLVDPPVDVPIIGSKWVFNIKLDEKNNPKRYKARLVAQGFKQRPGVDFSEIFSPVVNFNIVKLLFIMLVSVLHWYNVQLDIKSAYLYGKLKEPTFMRQPPGHVIRGSENKVCFLNKAIYGLHQSGREWNFELDNVLKQLGFVKLSWTNCVYKYKNDVVLTVYVDDIIIFGKTNELINEALELIKSKFDVTELGQTKYLLGVNFEYVNDSLYLHQNTYIEKLMIKFKELPKSHVKLPFKVGGVLPPKVPESDIIENDLMKKYPYRTLIGCLSFLADRSRPDISYSVNLMSQFCNGYTCQHWAFLVDILNYVFQTKSYKINLSNVNNNILCSYSDANWGCNLTNRHSSSGYIIQFYGIPFVWKSAKQKCIALSSMESEFVSLTESVKELIWYFRIIDELNVCKISTPIQFCDNQAAIYFSKNNQESIKTKHIDIKYQFIRQLIEEKLFQLQYVDSRNNLADFLTKPLLLTRFLIFVNNIFSL